MLSGGDTGPAIISGDPEGSLLISSVRYEDYEMPPKGKLKDSEIDVLTKWIKMGAPDPRQSQSSTGLQPMDLEAGKRFWAFSPLKDSQLPETVDRDWPRNEIDRYLLAKLESEGIRPVKDADRESLLRRIYLAVIGLPPTISQIDAFMVDGRSTEAILPGVVDGLLASPHFGERWGASLVGCCSVCRVEWRWSEFNVSGSLAISRLRYRFVQQRQTNRSIYCRTDCR